MSSLDHNCELVVVMPVYNEEASIFRVFSEWHEEISRWIGGFHFFIIDDGSYDRTPEILGRLLESNSAKLTVFNQKNVGHGQTCLRGYAWAVEQNAHYVLQIDSDGQCDPQFFAEFWAQRERYEVIYGKRAKRDDGRFRALASWLMKIALLVFARVSCVDANVPYRLMRTSVLPRILPRIPSTVNLANVALAVLLKRDPAVRHNYVNIRFRKRYGGSPSVSCRKFFSRGLQLIEQLRTLD